MFFIYSLFVCFGSEKFSRRDEKIFLRVKNFHLSRGHRKRRGEVDVREKNAQRGFVFLQKKSAVRADAVYEGKPLGLSQRE